MLGYFRHNLSEYIRANIVAYFFMILILVIGIVIGALAVKTLPEEQKTELAAYLKIFIQGLTKGTDNQDPNMFLSVIYNNAKTIVLMWLLGFTVIGIPFVVFIVFTRGFVIGFTVGFLVNEYVMRGFVFALVSVLPHNFFAIPAILATSVTAIAFSLLLVRRKVRGKANLLYQSFGYTLFCALMLALMAIAALVEFYISPVLMQAVARIFLK